LVPITAAFARYLEPKQWLCMREKWGGGVENEDYANEASGVSETEVSETPAFHQEAEDV
jgi:hypothetical protein